MKNLYYRLISQKITNTASITYIFTNFFILLTLISGCSQKAQEGVQLKIQGVQSKASNGEYTISGTTNLPDSSRIAIAAVRNFYPTQGEQDRSILARQIVEVKQGQWQASLNLWHIAPDGSFQELWQANQGLIKLTPENDVTFIATFDSASQLQKSNGQNLEKLNLENQTFDSKSLRFTSEGEKYVQASLASSIPLPTGKTTPPYPQAEDLNDGWGNRYQIQPQPLTSGVSLIPPAKSGQTDAHPTASEFLR